jgi:hypothetical protein
MNKFAIGTQADWCNVCGNTSTGCATTSTATVTVTATPSPRAGGSSSGISTAVGGVIGAMVTLAVVLGIEALILLVGGLRIAKKRSMASVPSNGAAAGVKA